MTFKQILKYIYFKNKTKTKNCFNIFNLHLYFDRGANMNNFEYRIDGRTELMAIILALSQCNEYAEEHFVLELEDNYRKDIKKHFLGFKNHKAICLAKELGQKEEGFCYDTPIRLAFELNEDYSYSGGLSGFYSNELDNLELAKDFLFAVENFAKETNFDNFYKKHKVYYDEKLLQLVDVFSGNIFKKHLVTFLKRHLSEHFAINIIPTLINSNHGFEVSGIFYANLGLPCEDFKTIAPFNGGYAHIIIHEFLHPFVNPLSEKLYYKHKETLLSNIKIEELPKGYQNKLSFINDTIVRALTIRLREHISPINTKKFLTLEKSWGFVYVEKIYNEILHYENQNNSWEEYFEKILTVFEKNMPIDEK